VKAAVIGLGQMGAAIAQALASAGHDVTVWNRTPGKTVENAVIAPNGR
jgi:3-hydroxyisobutyrate dehydrogenase-like beta-hydroxyacid dehydrogenase